MGLKCLFGGHQWNGCKCEKCDKTRDEGHSFIPVEGTCLEKCIICGKSHSTGKHIWNGCKCECGATRDEGHDWNGCACKKCGKKRDEGHNFVPINGECIEECAICGLMNRCALPLPEAQPPFPEFAKRHDLSIVVEVEKHGVELEISADKCTINWGDDRGTDEYSNVKGKRISYRYKEAGSYTITINATELSRFDCHALNTQITAIYLNNCSQLEYLNCGFNKLTALDISRCTALEFLLCNHNKLTSLDLSNNLALDYLSCDKNLLTCLDISNNIKLNSVDCSHNQLSILNLNPNSAIARLQCNNNKLSKHELDMVFNQLPNYNSSYGTVNTWYSGATSTPTVFCACGDNIGFNSCNKKIAETKNWLVWKKAMYIAATIAGTPGRWQEDFMH